MSFPDNDLLSSIWQTLHDIADDPKSIFQQISEAIPSVAVIEIGYILIQVILVLKSRKKNYSVLFCRA